jgi:hypothetical protein
MKKFITFLGACTFIFAAIIIVSCEGPAGPQGPPGEDGQDGLNGTDGTNGVAGNAVCLTCHNMATKNAITADWETTLHATSDELYPFGPLVVEYAGGRNDCAACHSHEGFVQTQFTGQDTTAANIPLPQPIQCKTCHDFHTSLDFTNEPNYALRTTDAVTLRTSGTEVSFGTYNSGNLCMHCHQARKNPHDDASPTAPTEVYEHYGPHLGPQANFINGEGGYEFGVVLSATGSHLTGADCASCHMHEGGTGTGGHTWMVGIESCTSCHTGATDFDVNGKKTAIEGLINDLKTALITAGLLDAEGHEVEGTYEADEAGALWNYLLIVSDASSGIHNPAYATALLNNSINVFN